MNPPTATLALDPITRELLRNSLVNIVGNMENAMLRTAFSLVARDFRDVACGLHAGTEQDLDLVAVAAGVPILSVVTHFGLKENVAEFGLDELRPGDELIFNDPFRGGNHAPDVTVARPIFEGDELVAFATTRSHWVDVGGVAPGSWPVGGTVRTVMEETSLRLPPMLLYREGQPVKSTHSLLLDATRAPHLVLGDLRAQHTANLIGEREVRELIGRYGLAGLKEGMRYTLDYGEARTRAALSKVNDGVYTAEDSIDDDGVEEGPFTIRCTMTVRSDSAELDFSGSDRQTIGNSSCPWGMSAACTHVALASLLDPAIPMNGGTLRPIDLIMPAGSIVHVLPYHACADGNGTLAPRLESVAVRLVNQALPERASGDFYGAASVTNLGGGLDPRPGKPPMPWVLFAGANSGYGATAHTDGHTGSVLPLANTYDTPVEVIEQDVPVVVVAKEFSEDSGGPGLNRGGMGVHVALGFLADGVGSNSTDRVLQENFGAAGGKGSMRSFLESTTGIADDIRTGAAAERRPIAGLYQDAETGEQTFMTGKLLNHPVAEDEVWHKLVPGGGGWGDPLQREPERVARDVRDRLVSVEGARDDYGVVLDDALEVDAEATTDLRARLARDPAFAERPGPASWHVRIAHTRTAAPRT